jgi:hypothetical protein
MRNLRLFVCAVPLVLFSVGCDEKLSDLTGPTPNLSPTFSSIEGHLQHTRSSGR